MIRFVSLVIILVLISCGKVRDKTKQIIDKSKKAVEKIDQSIDEAVNPTALQVFEKGTGLKITDSIYELSKINTYFPFEGELSVVFKTSTSQIDKWLQAEAPWENAEWKRGTIPDSVFNCKFGVDVLFSEDTIAEMDNKNIIRYNSDDLLKLRNNKNKYWVSKERCCPGMSYHNGNLLIIEREKNLVWYSNWDY